MSKKNKQFKTDTQKVREDLYRQYRNKYYTLYMSSYESPELDYEENNFIFQQFWSKGTVAGFIIKHTDIAKFVPYVPERWNSYNFPTDIRFIRLRDDPFVPIDRAFTVGVDAVIGYASKSGMPRALSIEEIVNTYIDKIVDIEMTIRTNLKLHKLPWIVGVTPENKDALMQLYNRIENDETAIFAETEVPLDSVNNGAPYIIDKLYQYKQAIENELLTFLGINNMPVQEKKERMITDEVSINNQLICHFADSFIDCLEDFSKQLKEVLGKDIHFVCKHHVEEFTAQDHNQEEQGDNEDEEI